MLSDKFREIPEYKKDDPGYKNDESVFLWAKILLGLRQGGVVALPEPCFLK